MPCQSRELLCPAPSRHPGYPPPRRQPLAPGWGVMGEVLVMPGCSPGVFWDAGLGLCGATQAEQPCLSFPLAQAGPGEGGSSGGPGLGLFLRNAKSAPPGGRILRRSRGRWVGSGNAARRRAKPSSLPVQDGAAGRGAGDARLPPGRPPPQRPQRLQLLGEVGLGRLGSGVVVGGWGADSGGVSPLGTCGHPMSSPSPASRQR